MFDMTGLDHSLPRWPIAAKAKLSSNNDTLKTKLHSSIDIHFEKDNSFGILFGFGKEILKANSFHESRFPVNIIATTIIRIECYIVSGSFVNGMPSHIIYEFLSDIPPRYRIIEIPKKINLLPSTNSISKINIRLLDAKDKSVNLRDKEIHLYLHVFE